MSECSSVNPDSSELRGDDAPETNVQTVAESKNNADKNVCDSENKGDDCQDNKIQTRDSESISEEMKNGLSDIEIKEQRESSDNRIGELGEGDTMPEDMIGEESDSDDDEEEEDDDDDDGWITPSNIKSMKEKMGGEDMQKADVQVGCLTTDFAMQVFKSRYNSSFCSEDLTLTHPC